MVPDPQKAGVCGRSSSSTSSMRRNSWPAWRSSGRTSFKLTLTIGSFFPYRVKSYRFLTNAAGTFPCTSNPRTSTSSAMLIFGARTVPPTQDVERSTDEKGSRVPVDPLSLTAKKSSARETQAKEIDAKRSFAYMIQVALGPKPQAKAQNRFRYKEKSRPRVSETCLKTAKLKHELQPPRFFPAAGAASGLPDNCRARASIFTASPFFFIFFNTIE